METRERIEGHKRIVRENGTKMYKVYSRHLVTDTETGINRREWFDSGDMREIRSVFNLVRELQRRENYTIWYGKNIESDLISFEEEMRNKKGVYFPKPKQLEMDTLRPR